jgi:hypothetical protein
VGGSENKPKHTHNDDVWSSSVEVADLPACRQWQRLKHQKPDYPVTLMCSSIMGRTKAGNQPVLTREQVGEASRHVLLRQMVVLKKLHGVRAK